MCPMSPMPVKLCNFTVVDSCATTKTWMAGPSLAITSLNLIEKYSEQFSLPWRERPQIATG
jgi:hypothetical protein